MDEMNQRKSRRNNKKDQGVQSQEALTLKGSGRWTEAHKEVWGTMAREIKELNEHNASKAKVGKNCKMEAGSSESEITNSLSISMAEKHWLDLATQKLLVTNNNGFSKVMDIDIKWLGSERQVNIVYWPLDWWKFETLVLVLAIN